MLYPLDMQIEMLMASFVDEDTGELKCSEEEMAKAVADLEMDFDKKILALRNSYLDTVLDAKRVAAEAKVLREEAANIQKRADSLENKAERKKRFLEYLLKSEKFEKDGAKISYRKSEECVIDDTFLVWAKTNRPELLTLTPKKADIKAALKNGENLRYVHIEERRHIQIK